MNKLELYSPIFTLIKEGKLMASWCTMHLWWAATLWFSDTSNCPHSLSRLVLQKAHFRRRAEAPFLCPDMTSFHTLHLSSVLKTKNIVTELQCTWRKREDYFCGSDKWKNKLLSFVWECENRWLKCMLVFFLKTPTSVIESLYMVEI